MHDLQLRTITRASTYPSPFGAIATPSEFPISIEEITKRPWRVSSFPTLAVVSAVGFSKYTFEVLYVLRLSWLLTCVICAFPTPEAERDNLLVAIRAPSGSRAQKVRT